MIRVSVLGAGGRMGTEVVRALKDAQDMQTALLLGPDDDPSSINPSNTDVAVDFTSPDAVLGNTLTLIGQGVHSVIGTTGWTKERLDQVRQALDGHVGLSVFIAPNFAISAVLADRFAAMAARYFESAEVVELHHPDKVDAPSGTALGTASAIAEARRQAGMGPMPDATQQADASRGRVVDGVHVHAVRLRGLNAHEEILMGNPGEQLTIRADSFERVSFMPGVLLAVRRAGSIPGLTVGLDHYLF